VDLGTRAQSGAVEDRQADGDADALLDAGERDGQQRHHRQPELEAVEASDGDEVAPVEDPRRDEDQHRGERRQRHILEQPGCGISSSSAAAAPRPAACVRPPAEAVAAVRAGSR